jgi:TctA family transporter
MDFTFGLAEGISDFLTVAVLVAFVIGVLNGLVFGAIPGLSGSLGIALMIPFSYGLTAESAIVLFCAALSGQTFAGSVSAILINTPGTSPNAATCFDGYPLTQQGKAGYAIGISATASSLGTIFGAASLIVLMPFVRQIILAFSFPEFTMLAVVGLAAIAVASQGNKVLGLVSGLIGVLISFIGFAPVGGELRFVFGQRWLTNGISVLPVLIGLFAITEVISLLLKSRAAKGGGVPTIEVEMGARRQPLQGVLYTFKNLPLVARSSALGTILGIVPAVGGTVASFMAYFAAEKTSKGGPGFGNGDPRGVIAPEAANDAKDAGSALPSLAFGIPGSAEWAIILGAMIIHGVQPGPLLVTQRPDIIWLSIIAIVLASFVTSALGLLVAGRLSAISRIRPAVLAPAIAALAISGSFALRGRISDVNIAIAFGLLGYAMRRIGMPPVPLILGLLLGTRTERSFQQTLLTFDSPMVFLTRPISLVLVIGTLYFLITALRPQRKQAGQKTASSVLNTVQSSARETRIALVLFGLFAAFARWQSQGLGDQSREAPVLVSNTLLIVILIALVAPILRDRRNNRKIAEGSVAGSAVAPAAAPTGASPSGSGADAGAVATATAAPAVAAQDRRDITLTLGMFVAAMLLTWAFGTTIALAIVVFAMFRVFTGMSWPRAAISATLAIGLIVWVFNVLLDLPLVGGSIIEFRYFL